MKKNNGRKTWKKSGRARNLIKNRGTVLMKLELSKYHMDKIREISKNTNKSTSSIITDMLRRGMNIIKDRENM